MPEPASLLAYAAGVPCGAFGFLHYCLSDESAALAQLAARPQPGQPCIYRDETIDRTCSSHTQPGGRRSQQSGHRRGAGMGQSQGAVRSKPSHIPLGSAASEKALHLNRSRGRQRHRHSTARAPAGDRTGHGYVTTQTTAGGMQGQAIPRREGNEKTANQE